MATEATKVDFDRAASPAVWAELERLRQDHETMLDALVEIEEAGLGGYLTPELCAHIVTTAIEKVRA